MIRNRRRLVQFGAVCLLVSCGPTSCGPSPEPEACLPESVDQLIQLQRRASEDVARVGDVRVYVDGSGSMAGFARAGQPGNTPFQDVIDSLTQLTASRAGSPRIRFFRLGDEHVPELTGTRAQIQDAIRSPEFYLCRGPAVGANCSFQKSRTTLVVQRIAEGPPTDVSIFLSDLWFSDDQIRSQPGVALRSSLAQILQTRDIVIYGFRAPYSATLDDLPSGDRSVRPPALPFYLVVAGPPARIREIRDNFERPGSRWISDNLGRERLPFSIFSASPLTAVEQPARRFTWNTDAPNPGVSGDAVVWRAQSEQIPDQFEIVAGRIRDSSTGPVWRWPTGLPAGLVWQGEFAPTVEIRRIRHKGSCDILDAEIDAPQIQMMDPDVPGAAPTYSFRLDPHALIDRPGLGEWLIVGRLHRTSIQENNPAAQWLRDWSFDATVQSEMAAKPRRDFFPTLNVAEFARLLEYAVDDAARRDARPAAGFITIVRIE